MFEGPVPARPSRRERSERVERVSALESLFREQYRTLVHAAWLLVDDQGSAEEIVQEAFLRIYRHWDRLASYHAAPTYLRTTVVNLARSRLRRRLVHRRHAPGPLDPAPSAEMHALATDEQHAVTAALATLPRRQRECLVLRFYLELSEAEIATTLGISRGSVKSHTHRGFNALAEIMGQPDAD
jgi:RNA polymerase sigma-70 factor (sigma-E family)